ETPIAAKDVAGADVVEILRAVGKAVIDIVALAAAIVVHDEHGVCVWAAEIEGFREREDFAGSDGGAVDAPGDGGIVGDEIGERDQRWWSRDAPTLAVGIGFGDAIEAVTELHQAEAAQIVRRAPAELHIQIAHRAELRDEHWGAGGWQDRRTARLDGDTPD